jgi:transposase
LDLQTAFGQSKAAFEQETSNLVDHCGSSHHPTLPHSMHATALVAAIGNGAGFRRGKDLAAWVGMVPREYSTGGKQKLLGISKRGNSYLRRLFVQGARVVMQYRSKQAPGLSNWLSQLMARTHQNVAVVALANKLLRMAWAVLCKNETYRIPALAPAP